MERLAPAYLIVGEDAYLLAQAAGEITSAAGEFNVDEFGPEADPGEILGALQTPAMFGDRRVVVVRGVEEFPPDFHRQIGSYLDNPNDAVTLVLASAKPLARLASSVGKVGRVVEVGKGKRSDLFGWLREEAKRRGFKVTGDALGALVEAVGEERMALAQALEELSLSLGVAERLSPEEVRLQFRGRADAKVFGFVDAVASRDAARALEALHLLLRNGESAQGLFWMLARHLKMLLLAAEGRPSEVAGALGIPAWRAEKLMRQSRNFTTEELVRAYRTMSEGDRKMKRSEEPDSLTLERVVVAIAG